MIRNIGNNNVAENHLRYLRLLSRYSLKSIITDAVSNKDVGLGLKKRKNLIFFVFAILLPLPLKAGVINHGTYTYGGATVAAETASKARGCIAWECYTCPTIGGARLCRWCVTLASLDPIAYSVNGNCSLDPLEEHRYYVVSNCTAGFQFDSDTGKCVPGDKNEGDSCDDQRGGTNPINLGVGNKYQTEADYVGGGVFPLSVSRTFNSISGVWQFLTEVRLNTAGTIAIVVRRDGKKLPFSADGVGGWIGDPDVTGSLASFTDGAGAITAWRYTTLDKTAEDYSASGKLLTVTDRSGLSHAYAHAATDISVTHSQGGVLVYQLDTNGRITGFVTPDNDQYSYGYDIADNLISINYPNSGGTRTYHYEDTYSPNTLTGITDANGARFATWTYDSLGRAISSEHNGGAEKVAIDYTYLENATDPRSTATNVLGKQTTYHFTTVHGVRRVVRVEGHPSAN